MLFPRARVERESLSNRKGQPPSHPCLAICMSRAFAFVVTALVTWLRWMLHCALQNLQGRVSCAASEDGGKAGAFSVLPSAGYVLSCRHPRKEGRKADSFLAPSPPPPLLRKLGADRQMHVVPTQPCLIVPCTMHTILARKWGELRSHHTNISTASNVHALQMLNVMPV